MSGGVTRRGGAIRGALLLLALVAAGPARGGERPVRVASLNLCTDELLVALADRADIASLSPLARDPDLSTVAAAAAALPDNQASAEEILRERADLVLTESGATDPTAQLLRRLGARVEALDPVDRLDRVAPTVRRIAAWLGREERGEALIARLSAELEAGPDGGRPLSAVLYEPAGWSDGAGTLMGDVLVAAGLANQAARLGIEGYRHLPLERVAADPPDLLVTMAYRPGEASLAEAWLGHPALRTIRRRVTVPIRLLLCGGPAIGEAVALLRAARLPALTAR